jgi:transposase
VSWFQLLDIIKQGRAEAEYYASQPPMACPLCGEPLRSAPNGSADRTLYCPYEGWSFPRDYVRPDLR